MLLRIAVHVGTCRRRYRPMWLPINGLSCLASVNAARLTDGQGGLGASAMVFRHPLRPWVMPVSRYFRLPASQEGCWGAYAVLLGVSDGGTDSRNDHGGMRDWSIRMTVDRNRCHHAEPRQQVIAPTALSRDDPMTARPLTQSSRVRRPPWLWDHSTTAHTPTSWPSLSPPCRCESQRVLLGGGTQHTADEANEHA